MIVFAQEKLSLIRDEAWPLLLRHWEEIALNKATTPLDPAWHMYKMLEDAGVFHVTTLRIDGVLVGYVAFLISANLHYRTVIEAVNDIYYLAPEHRKGRLGLKLLRTSIQAAKRLGATKIVFHHKVHMDLGSVFRHLGFELVEHVYRRAA